jgi:hypothetical protein
MSDKPDVIALPLDYTGPELILFGTVSELLTRICKSSIERRFGPNDGLVLLIKATAATLAEVVADNSTPAERIMVSDEAGLFMRMLVP